MDMTPLKTGSRLTFLHIDTVVFVPLYLKLLSNSLTYDLYILVHKIYFIYFYILPPQKMYASFVTLDRTLNLSKEKKNIDIEYEYQGVFHGFSFSPMSYTLFYE